MIIGEVEQVRPKSVILSRLGTRNGIFFDDYDVITSQYKVGYILSIENRYILSKYTFQGKLDFLRTLRRLSKPKATKNTKSFFDIYDVITTSLVAKTPPNFRNVFRNQRCLHTKFLCELPNLLPVAIMSIQNTPRYIRVLRNSSSTH